MTDIEAYWQALADLTAVSADRGRERSAAQDEYAAELAAAGAAAEESTRLAGSIAARTDAILGQARSRLAEAGLENRLPERVRPAATSSGEPDALLATAAHHADAIAHGVDRLLSHRQAARLRRLEEGAERERLADTTRHEREAAATRQWDDRVRRAQAAAAAVTTVLVIAGIVLAAALRSPYPAVLCVAGVAAWWPVRRMAMPAGRPPGPAAPARRS
jgi:hypothetical protein